MDWSGGWRTFGMVWGIPGGAMAAAALLDTRDRAIVWTIMLLWMAGACFANARRCGRTHCHITGPFFLLMAGLVAGYGFGLLPLGTYGWGILGGTTLVGFLMLWWVSERALGTFTG
jgi:hypothetical protein